MTYMVNQFSYIVPAYLASWVETYIYVKATLLWSGKEKLEPS